MSKGETEGGGRRFGIAGVIGTLGATGSLILILKSLPRPLEAAPIIILFLGNALYVTMLAVVHPSAGRIKQAVGTCVLGIILLDASFIAGMYGILYGFLSASVLLTLAICLRRFIYIT